MLTLWPSVGVESKEAQGVSGVQILQMEHTEMTTEIKSTTGPTANQPKSRKLPNRFMLSFGAEDAATYDAIIADAKADRRDPGEYLMIWLGKNYSSGIHGSAEK